MKVKLGWDHTYSLLAYLKMSLTWDDLLMGFLNACNEIYNEPIIDNYGGLLTGNS